MLSKEHFMYGADYNPDQWQAYPEILERDIELMKKANINFVTLGIFAWVAYEKEEGKYSFEWLDQVFDRLEKANIGVILATPSGSRPAWMSQKYPEVLRTTQDRRKNLHGARHNHCFTSPVYREKTYEIDFKLAERYNNRKNLIGFHISNELGGECHCELCQKAFREFLKKKYKTLDDLNQAWWSAFWSHTFTDWDQIESPSTLGETLHHAQVLDWKRFVTEQTISFYNNEYKAIRDAGNMRPITTNFEAANMTILNLWEFQKHVDTIAVDIYPEWENDREELYETAQCQSFMNVMNRSFHNKPFLLIECAPNQVNWHMVNKLKRPNLNRLAVMQTIANGADGVAYFQFRSSRGSSEKFHSAIVNHTGDDHSRTYREVAALGEELKHLTGVLGTSTKSEVALMYDFENRAIISEIEALRRDKKDYLNIVLQHYGALWNSGVNVDIISPESDLSKYKMIILPMQYMMSENLGARVNAYVENGGILITTYCSGIANETDLCYMGAFPAMIDHTLGIEAVETQTYYDGDNYTVQYHDKNYKIKYYCDILELKGAKELAEYNGDFFANTPALTVNQYGKGFGYYIGFRSETDFLTAFYKDILQEHGITHYDLPKGVTVSTREKYKFVMNWTLNQVYVKPFDISLPPLDYKLIRDE